MSQTHHITYEPEWTVEVNGFDHRAITTMQRMKATPANYAQITNVMHAVSKIWNDMRMELDIGEG